MCAPNEDMRKNGGRNHQRKQDGHFMILVWCLKRHIFARKKCNYLPIFSHQIHCWKLDWRPSWNDINIVKIVKIILKNTFIILYIIYLKVPLSNVSLRKTWITVNKIFCTWYFNLKKLSFSLQQLSKGFFPKKLLIVLFFYFFQHPSFIMNKNVL